MKTTRQILPATLIAIAVLAVGCGRTEKPAAVSAPAVTKPVEGNTLEIIVNDTMKYSVAEIHAKPGETVHLTLRNTGTMPKQAMGHNWVLLKPMDEAAVQAFCIDAATKGPTYLPDDQSAILAHTKMLGPGESDSLEFKAPVEPGEYPFVCTFPGHFLQMKGRLVVK
jgi:azurin